MRAAQCCDLAGKSWLVIMASGDDQLSSSWLVLETSWCTTEHTVTVLETKPCEHAQFLIIKQHPDS